jgi:hypothetical protein
MLYGGIAITNAVFVQVKIQIRPRANAATRNLDWTANRNLVAANLRSSASLGVASIKSSISLITS